MDSRLGPTHGNGDGRRATSGTLAMQNPHIVTPDVEVHIAALRRQKIEHIKAANAARAGVNPQSILYDMPDSEAAFDIFEGDLLFTSAEREELKGGVEVITRPVLPGKVWAGWGGLDDKVAPILFGVAAISFPMGSVLRSRSAQPNISAFVAGAASCECIDPMATPGDKMMWVKPTDGMVGAVVSVGLKSIVSRMTAKLVVYRPTGSTMQNPVVRMYKALRLEPSELTTLTDFVGELRNALADMLTAANPNTDALKQAIANAAHKDGAWVDARADEMRYGGGGARAESPAVGYVMLAFLQMTQKNYQIEYGMKSNIVGTAMSQMKNGRIDVSLEIA